MTTEQSLPTAHPRPFLHRVLFLYAMVLGIETGGAIFTSMVVFPAWTASPEAVVQWKPDSVFYMEEGDFFMYASTLTFILSIITLIAGWNAVQPLRKWLRIAPVIFLIVFAVSWAYFIPIQADMKGDPGLQIPPEKLQSMLSTFVNTNYLRVGSLVVALFCAIHSLGLSYRLFGAKPLTYT